MGNFHSSKAFDPTEDIIDLSGKVAIVTGGKYVHPVAPCAADE
jgi:hypothetical protein